MGAPAASSSGAGPVAEEAAQRVLRILDGQALVGIPITKGSFARPIFDWRQLQRFAIDERRLPPGSDIRFRPPSLWTQYRWPIIATVVVVLVQGLMISSLLLERSRRRAAELESRRRILEVIHLNRSATAGALSASIAHELYQPLGAILINAKAAEDLLKAQPPDLDEVKEILADIRRDDQRAGDVIRHLRGLLRKGEIEIRQFDLNDAVRDALDVLESEAHMRGVTLSVDQAPGTVPVRANQVHLEQVILNLATNGMDAMSTCAPGMRRLTLQTALVGDSEVEISVSDSGTGIPEDRLKNIFATFYTTKPQGTGLGLSIARSIVETYGGRIWAENRSTGGAVFRFTLPLARATNAS